jgi:hypothetical protein
MYVCCLIGPELTLGTGPTLAPTLQVPSEDHFLAPAFVLSLVRELPADAFFWPIARGGAVTLGKPVDQHCTAILDAALATPGRVFLVLCGLLYWMGQGDADRLCIPAGGCLLSQVLRKCHAW